MRDRRLTRGWSGPARDQRASAGPRCAPAAQRQVVGRCGDTWITERLLTARRSLPNPTAETLKVGVMGQEVQISGTAKELAKERALLAQSTSEVAPGKLQIMDRAARELNNPMADLIGLKLLQSSTPIRLENLVHALVTAMSTGPEPPKHPPMVILAMTREVEKVLATLQSLHFAKVKEGEYELTAEGRRFFQRVADQQGEFLARFNAIQ